MWSRTEDHTPGAGAGVKSGIASVAAHKAATKLKIKSALRGAAPNPGGAPLAAGANPVGNYKQHIAIGAAHQGVPVNLDDIHGAIGALTQAGQFTPQQGAALIAHNGPLQGAAGAHTMKSIMTTAMHRKMAPKPPMGGAPMPHPMAPPGMPPGMAPPGGPSNQAPPMPQPMPPGGGMPRPPGAM